MQWNVHYLPPFAEPWHWHQSWDSWSEEFDFVDWVHKQPVNSIRIHFHNICFCNLKRHSWHFFTNETEQFQAQQHDSHYQLYGNLLASPSLNETALSCPRSELTLLWCIIRDAKHVQSTICKSLSNLKETYNWCSPAKRMQSPEKWFIQSHWSWWDVKSYTIFLWDSDRRRNRETNCCAKYHDFFPKLGKLSGQSITKGVL